MQHSNKRDEVLWRMLKSLTDTAQANR